MVFLGGGVSRLTLVMVPFTFGLPPIFVLVFIPLSLSLVVVTVESGSAVTAGSSWPCTRKRRASSTILPLSSLSWAVEVGQGRWRGGVGGRAGSEANSDGLDDGDSGADMTGVSLFLSLFLSLSFSLPLSVCVSASLSLSPRLCMYFCLFLSLSVCLGVSPLQCLAIPPLVHVSHRHLVLTLVGVSDDESMEEEDAGTKERGAADHKHVDVNTEASQPGPFHKVKSRHVTSNSNAR